MPWELYIDRPGFALDQTFTHESDPNPIMGGIEAVVDEGGRTSSITLRARNDLLQAAPRSMLQYRAWRELALTFNARVLTFGGADLTVRDNYDWLASGVVVTSPPITSPGSGPADGDADALERISAVGLEQIVSERLVPAVIFGEDDVASIAYRICDLGRLSPWVGVSADNFPPTGHILGFFYAPEMTVADALDELTASLPGGGTWWVDGRRRINFRANA